MIITHHGVDFFKVSFGDMTLAVNPISKDSKFKSSRFGSDITLISLINSPDHNGSDSTSRGDKESFIISGPGEYEVSGVFIKGFATTSNYKGKQSINTIYKITLEGMNLCFLGGMSDEKIPKEVTEEIDGIDLLFVPIGGDGVLPASLAHKIAVQFEPKIIIPSHFDGIGDEKSLKTFLKEAGAEKAEEVDKLTIKKKDLEGKEGEVIIINSSN